MSFDVDKLYALLPAVYRIRDAELAGPQDDGPLQALLSIIAEQAAVHTEDLEQLYDDLFIETCAEWVVPYIGDLVGTHGLFVFPQASFSQRAQVANTLAYRRRKGTAAVLEQLARDVTDWDASVIEYFQLLATTQYLNHVRLGNLATPDLRQWEPLERINTPFDLVAHTVDVRRITTQHGRYNIPNVGIFLWRIGSFSMTEAPAFKVDDRRFLFDALGKDTPLYNRPESEDQITHLAEPINVPMPLGRRILDRDKTVYYGIGKSLSLKVDNTNIAANEVVICDLSDQGSTWAHMVQDTYAIDPVLGRLVLPAAHSASANVQVSYHYGFSAEMGSGEYSRASTFTGGLQHVIKVPSQQPTIQVALNQLAALLAGPTDALGGVVEIEQNDYFVETPSITVPAGKVIELRAANQRRPILVLNGALSIFGGEGAQVILNGLLVSGGALRVPAKNSGNQENRLGQLRLWHCTLVPGATPTIKTVPAQPAMPRLLIEAANVTIEFERSITGAIRSNDAAHVRISNSIVDAGAETEVAYAALDGGAAGAPLTVQNSTLIGKVHTLLMQLASNTIFLASRQAFDVWPAPVRAARLQQGCVRFSYVPPGSQLPRQFQCQPAKEGEAARMRPVFTSLRYGEAGYCQLSPHCAVEIRQGADDQAEMGVFHDLYQPQREANLRARLDEYLRFGLEAGIFYAS
jgi:hypothetical protein